MKREPSIHVTLSKFIEIMEELDLPTDKVTMHNIFKKASKYSINSRSMLITNDKVKRDANRVAKSSEGDTMLLNNIIYLIRTTKLKHRGVSKFKPGNTSQWTLLKELSNKCLSFCNDFQLSKKDGFTQYLEIGLPKISSSRNLLNKLVNMYESICSIYDSKQIIENDDFASKTREIHDYYVRKIESDTGIYHPYLDDPNIYKCFVGVREIVDKYKIPYSMYIDAQFIGLSFTESIATPYQLISDKAVERLNNYLYKNRLKIDLPNDGNTIKLDRVKILEKIKNGNNRDK